MKTKLILVGILVVVIAFFAFKGYKTNSTPSNSATSTPVENVGTSTSVLPANWKIDSIEYKNQKYGFALKLPKSWTGYSIVNETWEGREIQSGNVATSGPKVVIRHPLWTAEKKTQDIPVMVFTLAQWNKIGDERTGKEPEIIVSAAPVGPRLLGKNSKYAFALPPRYNFGDAERIQEVDEIMNSDFFRAF